jgi:hypothetical protein
LYAGKMTISQLTKARAAHPSAPIDQSRFKLS